MHRLILILIASVTFSCAEKKQEKTFSQQVDELGDDWLQQLPGDSILKEGDIIARQGKDFVSDAMRNFSDSNKDYSHVGILAKDANSNWVVYHAIGSSSNPEGFLRKDRLALFCNPIENRSFGVFRYNADSINIKRLKQYAEKHYNAKTPFDYDFKMNTDNELYCSEFVYKAFKFANPELNLIEVYKKEEKNYLPLDRVYHNINCRLIYKTSFD